MALAWKLYKLKFELRSLLVRMGGWVGGGWVVDKTKIMLSQLQTEVELKSELSLATLMTLSLCGWWVVV